jgi:hypothetical protein
MATHLNVLFGMVGMNYASWNVRSLLVRFFENSIMEINIIQVGFGESDETMNHWISIHSSVEMGMLIIV